MSDVKSCDICGGQAPHGLDECRRNLLARVRSVQDRARFAPRPKAAPAVRTSPLKDQGGVALSEAFMQLHGLGRYGKRETALTLSNRVTEPITLEHFVVVVSDGRCLSCAVVIKCCTAPNGGKFWTCEDRECGWYIGWRAAEGRGEQLKIDKQTGGKDV